MPSLALGESSHLKPDPELPKVIRVIPLKPYQPTKDTPKGLLIDLIV